MNKKKQFFYYTIIFLTIYIFFTIISVYKNPISFNTKYKIFYIVKKHKHNIVKKNKHIMKHLWSKRKYYYYYNS